MPVPQRAAAHAGPAGMMEPPAVPERIAPPGDLLLATPISAQHLASPVVKTGQVTPQLRRGSDSCASIGHQGAAASLPVAVGQTGLLTEQVASEGSFRFQPQPDCVQGVSGGVCCTPVLRLRSQQAAHAGRSVSTCHMRLHKRSCCAILANLGPVFQLWQRRFAC